MVQSPPLSETWNPTSSPQEAAITTRLSRHSLGCEHACRTLSTTPSRVALLLPAAAQEEGKPAPHHHAPIQGWNGSAISYHISVCTYICLWAPGIQQIAFSRSVPILWHSVAPTYVPKLPSRDLFLSTLSPEACPHLGMVQGKPSAKTLPRSMQRSLKWTITLEPVPWPYLVYQYRCSHTESS